MIEFYSKANLPTLYGNFEIYVFRDNALEHAVLFKQYQDSPVLVRLHSKCLTGDTLGSLRCDCGFQLQQALAAISKVGGLLIYLDQEGRGIGLANKIMAYSLQEKGCDTVDANLSLGFGADERSFAPAASILEYFNLREIALLTNNPKKISELESRGFDVFRIPLPANMTQHNLNYLEAKKQKMGHDIVCGDCDIVKRYRELVRKLARRAMKGRKFSQPRRQIR